MVSQMSTEEETEVALVRAEAVLSEAAVDVEMVQEETLEAAEAVVRAEVSLRSDITGTFTLLTDS